MKPLFHAYDPEQKALRLGLGMTLLALGVGVVLVVLIDDSEMELLERLAVLSPALLLLVVAELTTFRHRTQGTQDWLRLDSEGLTLHRGGRARSWRWSELSHFRLHGYPHPATLFVGRAISFRGPRAGRQSALVALLNRILFAGNNVVIGDVYLSYPKDLLRRLNHYRHQATSRESRSSRSRAAERTRAASPDVPALFHLRDRKQQKTQAVAAILAVLGGGALGLVLIGAFSATPSLGWPLDWEAFNAFFSENSEILSVGSVAILGGLMSIPINLKRSSANGNLLLLSSDGLHIRRNGERRHWLWHEISEVELRHAPGAETTGGSGEVIGFVASHDGKRPGKGAEGGPLQAAVAQAIEDIYDAPLRDIARQIDAWRAAAPAFEPPPEVAPAAALEAARVPTRESARQQSPDNAISFRRRWAPATSVFASLATWLIVLLAIASLAAYTWIDSAEAPRNARLAVVWGVLILWMVAPLLLVFMAVGGGTNQLRLDRAGLTYTRLGRPAGWPWRELSSIELRQGKLRWSRKPVTIITMALPRDDRLSRLLRWAYGLRAAGPLTVIEDVYETPLPEIARQLEDYRRRA